MARLARRVSVAVRSSAVPGRSSGQASVQRSVMEACVVDRAEQDTGRTADEALRLLREGNARFVAGRMAHPHLAPERRRALRSGQAPFAVVFGCVDARVPVELIFDRGLGDLLVVRTAGPTLDRAALGSIVFGVAVLGAPLIVVLGHEGCGAVAATIKALSGGTSLGAELDALVAAIRPAIEQARGRPGDLLEQAIRCHVALTVAKLRATPVLADALRQGRLAIVGAHYALDSGVVSFDLA
jgi:carbonic anhydrase